MNLYSEKLGIIDNENKLKKRKKIKRLLNYIFYFLKNYLNFFSIKNTMDYCVYMLKSIERKSVTYVGHTKDLKNRLKLHNAGKGAKFTRGRHWKIIYSEKYATKNEAKSREYYIKKNRKFRNLIKERHK